MMKKILSFLLLPVLCLSLWACKDPEAVPETVPTESTVNEAFAGLEAMLAALSPITADSYEALCDVQAAYNSLLETQQQEFPGKTQLQECWNRYYTLALIGQWCNGDLPETLTPEELEVIKTPVLTLLEDQTYSLTLKKTCTGTWSVTDGTLILEGTNGGNYQISRRQEKLCLSGASFSCLYRSDWYVPRLEEVFQVVKINSKTAANYFDITTIRSDIVDQRGDPIGWQEVYIPAVCPPASDLIYMSASEDFLTEVTFPQHAHDRTEGTQVTARRCKAENWTFDRDDLQGTAIGSCTAAASTDRYTEEIRLSGSLSFGRARGYLLFVNRQYVDIRYENGKQLLTLKTDMI